MKHATEEMTKKFIQMEVNLEEFTEYIQHLAECALCSTRHYKAIRKIREGQVNLLKKFQSIIPDLGTPMFMGDIKLPEGLLSLEKAVSGTMHAKDDDDDDEADELTDEDLRNWIKKILKRMATYPDPDMLTFTELGIAKYDESGFGVHLAHCHSCQEHMRRLAVEVQRCVEASPNDKYLLRLKTLITKLQEYHIQLTDDSPEEKKELGGDGTLSFSA